MYIFYELVGINSLHVVEFYFLLFRVLQYMIARLLDDLNLDAYIKNENSILLLYPQTVHCVHNNLSSMYSKICLTIVFICQL